MLTIERNKNKKVEETTTQVINEKTKDSLNQTQIEEQEFNEENFLAMLNSGELQSTSEEDNPVEKIKKELKNVTFSFDISSRKMKNLKKIYLEILMNKEWEYL